ncbi:MAG: CYTH domain-containing protein [Bacteroidales bacterium]
MGKEIERKFLVKGEFKSFSVKNINITQAYLSVDPDRTVRLRITDNEAFLTIKTSSGRTGITRNEWEIKISLPIAHELIEVCLPGRILKTRYIVPYGEHDFEVDVFHGRHEGLVVAEIELPDEGEEFSRPLWLGEEVTGKPEYYNANLIEK